MRRTLTVVALLACAVPTGALADDEKKPEETGSSSAEMAFKHQGALFDASPQQRHSMLSFFAFVPWTYGLGIGGAARYSIPILADGFISRLNDSIELEFGADIWAGSYVGYGYLGLAVPVAEGRWTFHLTEQWDVYGKVGFGWTFTVGAYTGAAPWAGFFWNAGPGVLYKFGDGLYARAEIGYQGLRAGVGINF